MKNENLCFIRYIGSDNEGDNIYEFLFTDEIDTFWFENAEYKPLGMVNNIEIQQDLYTTTKLVKTKIKFDLIQESTCFGFQDCIDGCVSIAYENMDNYDEYPEDGRLVLMYGETYEDVENKLANKSILMEEK